MQVHLLASCTWQKPVTFLQEAEVIAKYCNFKTTRTKKNVDTVQQKKM